MVLQEQGPPMLFYLDSRKEAFGPDEIAVLVGAFEQSCQSVLVDFDADGGDAARELLAKRIIETASKGELDKDRLVKDALDHLAATLVNAPPLSPSSVEDPPAATG
jgi:hypothetical protein